jgi:hypothetical protein
MRNVLKSLLVAALATGGAALVLKALALDAEDASAPHAGPDDGAPDFMNMSDEELENMSDEQMLDALMGELSSYV